MNNEHAENSTQKEIDEINIRFGLLGHFSARKKLDKDYHLFWGKGKPEQRAVRESSWWTRETERLELITLLDLNPVQESRFARILKNARKKQNYYEAKLQASAVKDGKSVSTEKPPNYTIKEFWNNDLARLLRHTSITSYIRNCYPGAMIKKDFLTARDDYEITPAAASEIYMRFPQEIEDHCDQFTAEKIATAETGKAGTEDVTVLQINLAVGQIIEDLYAKYRRHIEKEPSKTINEVLARTR